MQVKANKKRFTADEFFVCSLAFYLITLNAFLQVFN